MASCANDLAISSINQNSVGKPVNDSFIPRCDQAHQVDESFHRNTRVRLSQSHNAAKTSRLTENKRRYRARRKEYVSDLERRLAEAREQGVKATTEVQLAARKVVVENGRLRELLQLVGFTDEDIEVWARQDNANVTDFARRREVGQKARLCFASTAGQNGAVMEGQQPCSPRKSNIEREMSRAREIPETAITPSSTEEPLVSELNSNRPGSDSTTAPSLAPIATEAPAAVPVQPRICRGIQIMPCKLLSHLAENPAADITQIPVPPSSSHPAEDATHHGGDVECGKAYEMLMQYATSEEKMDRVAQALEGGCTPTGKGGCAVKKNVVWEALDSMSP
ncbi:hypothetical protein V2G26_019933 [Clonostachys chloroleuca]